MTSTRHGYLSCNHCGHEVPNVSWDNLQHIKTVLVGNEWHPICPECNQYAEFSANDDMTTTINGAERWRVERFQSGTQIVTSSRAGEPWLYVYGPVGDDMTRSTMCDELASWLNGSARPAWMDDMRRRTEYEIFDVDGSSISATGPVYDSEPPKLCWRQCEDDESKNKRARLIDWLWFSREGVAP